MLELCELILNQLVPFDHELFVVLEGFFSSVVVIGLSVSRLNADEQIQMVTALALQLIQCVVKLPSHTSADQCQSNDLDDLCSTKKKNDFVSSFFSFTEHYYF